MGDKNPKKAPKKKKKIDKAVTPASMDDNNNSR
jgi:hypothetical protein